MIIPTFWTFAGQLPSKSSLTTPKDSHTRDTQIFYQFLVHCDRGFSHISCSLQPSTFGSWIFAADSFLDISNSVLPQVELMDRFIGDHFEWTHLKRRKHPLRETSKWLDVVTVAVVVVSVITGGNVCMRKTHPNPQVSPEFCQLRVELCDGWWPEVRVISTSKRWVPHHFLSPSIILK